MKTIANWLNEKCRSLKEPQFFWDRLPPTFKSESILRLDHLQAIGSHYFTYELSGFRLNIEALEIIDDWLDWFIYGGIPEESPILDYSELINEYYQK